MSAELDAILVHCDEAARRGTVLTLRASPIPAHWSEREHKNYAWAFEHARAQLAEQRQQQQQTPLPDSSVWRVAGALGKVLSWARGPSRPRNAAELYAWCFIHAMDTTSSTYSSDARLFLQCVPMDPPFMRMVLAYMDTHAACTRFHDEEIAWLRAYLYERDAIDRSNLYNLLRERAGRDVADHFIAFTHARTGIGGERPMRYNILPEQTKPDGRQGQLVRTTKRERADAAEEEVSAKRVRNK
jgi:hypothetical protein